MVYPADMVFGIAIKIGGTHRRVSRPKLDMTSSIWIVINRNASVIQIYVIKDCLLVSGCATNVSTLIFAYHFNVKDFKSVSKCIKATNGQVWCLTTAGQEFYRYFENCALLGEMLKECEHDTRHSLQKRVSPYAAISLRSHAFMPCLRCMKIKSAVPYTDHMTSPL